MRLYLKITLASFAVSAVVLAFVGINVYRTQRRELERSYGHRLVAIAATAAPWIDPRADEYRHRLALLRVKEANGLADYDVLMLKPLPDGTFEFSAALRPWGGDRSYDPPPALRPILADVVSKGVARATPLYTDNFATFVSGFAPVKGRSGKVEQVIEVDQDVGEFLKTLRHHLLMQLWILPAALAIAAALSLPLALSLTRAVNVLIAGVEAVAAGRYDEPVEVRTHDELRRLAGAFNGMLRGLRERFAMQRFIPKHTRAVIAEAVAEKGADAGAFTARTRDVAVLFSDIRGFTGVSEQIAPDRIIEMLNIYLRHEAEIVERHGGSIDKFIGDAVMAVFEGDDRAARAADAAAEIQKTFRELNAKKAFERPIEVGIGIAGGAVVLGSVGYEERMEFAAIGPVVNLASRLCSIAERGEIVASEAVYAALKGRREGERRDGVKLKGFAEAVTCWRLAA